jgi:hypothetical protein
MNDEIEHETYRKYYKKYQLEKALLNEEINFLTKLQDDSYNEQMELLPYLLSMPAIYEKANLNQKHSLLNGVFNRGLMFGGGAFRTFYINPVFRHNL